MTISVVLGQLGVISPSGFLLQFCCAIQKHEITIKMFQGQLIKASCIYSTCPYTAVQSQKAVSDYFTSKHIGDGRAKRDIGQSGTLKL